MSNAHFYRDLEPFHRFVEEAFEVRFYRPLPDDWLVAVADVISSTHAVEHGKYNEVNYVGAACIAAVNNALKGFEVPSVFGGDGATFAIPPEARTATIDALVATKNWARTSFGLELRVGVVPAAELKSRGVDLDVAKLSLSAGNAMAMFRGGGLDLADRLIKDDDGSQGYLVGASDGDAPPDLKSLSCRWAPLPSENGNMLCLIVGACDTQTAAADATYRDVLGMVDSVAGLGQAQVCPVKVEKLRFKLRLEGMRKEVKTQAGPAWVSWPKTVLFHVMIWVLFKFGLKAGQFDPEKYRGEITVNSDFRKVNGMLRLIIDCTPTQCDEIETQLEAMYQAGRIVFGAHRASRAIMTCVSPNIVNNEHVHYIDGSEGGFWSAAKGLKQRLSAVAQSSP